MGEEYQDIKTSDIRKALNLVKHHQKQLLEKWNEMHKVKKRPKDSKRKTLKE